MGNRPAESVLSAGVKSAASEPVSLFGGAISSAKLDVHQLLMFSIWLACTQLNGPAAHSISVRALVSRSASASQLAALCIVGAANRPWPDATLASSRNP